MLTATTNTAIRNTITTTITTTIIIRRATIEMAAENSNKNISSIRVTPNMEITNINENVCNNINDRSDLFLILYNFMVYLFCF